MDDQPLDHAVLPTHHRRKQLLLCDMDSTVIEIECIDELADFAGIKPEIAAVTRQAMNGEIDFAEALRARVALLAGLPEEAIEQVIAERLTLTPGATTMVRTMRANGARTALVSGGFTPFTRHVQALCGFDEEEANGLEIADGRLTGRVAGTVRDASAKLMALQAIARGAGPARGRDPRRRRRRQRPARWSRPPAWASVSGRTRFCAATPMHASKSAT